MLRQRCYACALIICPVLPEIILFDYTTTLVLSPHFTVGHIEAQGGQGHMEQWQSYDLNPDPSPFLPKHCGTSPKDTCHQQRVPSIQPLHVRSQTWPFVFCRPAFLLRESYFACYRDRYPHRKPWWPIKMLGRLPLARPGATMRTQTASSSDLSRCWLHSLVGLVQVQILLGKATEITDQIKL